MHLWVLSTKLPRVNTQHFINSSFIGSTPWGAIDSDRVTLQSMGVLHWGCCPFLLLDPCSVSYPVHSTWISPRPNQYTLIPNIYQHSLSECNLCVRGGHDHYQTQLSPLETTCEQTCFLDLSVVWLTSSKLHTSLEFCLLARPENTVLFPHYDCSAITCHGDPP